jgi:hypothetical protein
MRIGTGLLALAAVASLSPAARGEAQPHRSAGELVSSNGRAVVGFDVKQQRVTSFLEHPYRQKSSGAETRDVAFDVYPGVRVGSAGKWLGDVAPSSLAYETGTGIIHVTRSHAGLAIDEYVFAPIELTEHAFVKLLRVQRVSGSGTVDVYGLYNFHLGAGAPEPGSGQETIAWDGARDAFLEWGPSGLTLGIGSIGASSHHGASPQNPFPALNAGQNLADNAGTGGAMDDAVAGLQWSLGDLAVGEAKWAGSFVVLDSQSNVAPRIDAVRAWIGTKTPEQLLLAEKAAWTAWHTPVPTGLSSLEDALYRQQMAILRMGQVREPGKGDGQVLASLPPGNWNISWVRDMAYAVVAMAKSGHGSEAKRAIEFQLNADSGKYQSYVGHPYQISITRYFGDGVEETDSNQDGPNIEFDGFGLFLWELGEYLKASKDTAFLAASWPVVSQKIADVLVKLQEPSGLLAADSSIWEVHWNGQQKHFAYTTLTAAAGLCWAAGMAEQVGDSARAAEYRAAGKKAQAALISQLSATDGTLAQSSEDLAKGSGFLDAAAIEAVGLGLVNPKGKAATATLAAMKQKLVPPSGRGFMRNDDGGWYDSQEWVFVDLRTVSAMQLGGDPDAPGLLGWNTAQGTENFGLISELHDATTADYQGEMPMIGFGAGAYSIALIDRATPPTPMPCGEYALEGSGGSGGSGTGGASGGGGAAGGAGKAGAGGGGGAGGSGGTGSGGTAGGAEDDEGCGCRAPASEKRPSLAALGIALLCLGARRWRRRAS